MTSNALAALALLVATRFAMVSSFTTTCAPTTAASRTISRPSLTVLQAITLYGHPGTPLVNWAIHELGVDCSMAQDLSKNPHPFGQLPCLTDDDAVLFESGAILQYLHQTYGPTTLTNAQRAAITSWITWANASLDPICFLETADGKVYDTGLKRRPNKRIDRLDTILSEQDYLVKGVFTLADVAVASYLLYVIQFFPDVDLSAWPAIVKYMKNCASREAYGQAFGQTLQSKLAEKLSGEKEGSKKLFGMF
jgi:glutathione S-transferase